MQKNKLPKRLFCLLLMFGFLWINSGEMWKHILPLKTAAGSTSKMKCVEGKGECVMEMSSRRILYASNSELPLPMASTTKIVTAATVLDTCSNLQETISIPKEAVGIEGSSVYLKENDRYTVEDLLYGLMLRSGNDCAMALALHCGKTKENFSKFMNITAQKAGALNSNFTNPHGLPQTEHYTTAQDLCYITCYAMENPIYRQIVSTTYYRPYNWKNKNKMLTIYEGANGGKTGYTKEAGRCLVSTAERDNMSLVCTVLNCSTTYERSTELLDDAFLNYKYVQIITENEAFNIKSDGKEYVGYAKQNFSYPLLEDERSLLEIKTYPIKNNNKHIKKDEIIGQFEIYLAKRLLFSGNLYKL